MKTIPSDPAAADSAFPWIAFEGRWGELQKAFFNGPTGPEHEDAVDETRSTWSRGLARPELRGARRRRLRDGGDRPLLRRRRDGLEGLVPLLGNPPPTLLVVAGLLGLIVFAVVRATWRPSAPLRIARRRTWGQIISTVGAGCTCSGPGSSSASALS